MDSQISNTSNQLNMQKVYELAQRNIFNGDSLGFQTESTNVVGELKWWNLNWMIILTDFIIDARAKQFMDTSNGGSKNGWFQQLSNV